jgi:hypothetical protein
MNGKKAAFTLLIVLLLSGCASRASSGGDEDLARKERALTESLGVEIEDIAIVRIADRAQVSSLQKYRGPQPWQARVTDDWEKRDGRWLLVRCR